MSRDRTVVVIVGDDSERARVRDRLGDALNQVGVEVLTEREALALAASYERVSSLEQTIAEIGLEIKQLAQLAGEPENRTGRRERKKRKKQQTPEEVYGAPPPKRRRGRGRRK